MDQGGTLSVTSTWEDAMKGPFEAPPQLRGAFVRLGRHEEFDWQPLPWEGVYNKVLFFDYATGATLELARVEAGATFPEHYHTTMQTLFLVEGRLRSHADVIEPGTFNVIPAGQRHGPFEAEIESIQFKYFPSTPVYILTDGATFIYKPDGTTIDAGSLRGEAFSDANPISGDAL
jgi:mannose-6-phosphate isomerase-like protein (cupin superfamily)